MSDIPGRHGHDLQVLSQDLLRGTEENHNNIIHDSWPLAGIQTRYLPNAN